ncbi:MAG: prenyltransferase [Bacteroidales bacterium]|jgi:1,4-dihydroxy-2-naphthoate octaprenyltransferase|nr:prenyltransferase [Bacteroidales bacterium]
MSFSFWFKSTRPWSLPASTMPVVLSAAYLFYDQEMEWTIVHWWFLPFVLIAVICCHLGLNMISDFYDFKLGVDNENSLGYKSPLVKNEVDAEKWSAVALGILAVGALVGMILFAFSRWQLLWIGGIGVFAGYLYSCFFKKHAMGDLLIFVLFGLLIVQGTFYTLTSDLSLIAVFLAIPIGFITVCILHANNTRDIAYDSKVNFRSQAAVLGFRNAQWQYALLIFGAYLAVILMVVFTILPIWSLLVLFTLPIALANVRAMFKASKDNLEPIMFLDEATAKLQLAFTLSLSLGLFITALFA